MDADPRFERIAVRLLSGVSGGGGWGHANRVAFAPGFDEALGIEIKKQMETPNEAFEHVSALNLRADLDHSKILWLCPKRRDARV